MSMRIVVQNPEPGFSDARLAVQSKSGGEKIVLNGGQQHEFIVESGPDHQLVVQAFKRGSEGKKA